MPRIHNVKSTDIAIDGNDPMALLRLFNEPVGQALLQNKIGMSDAGIGVMYGSRVKEPRQS